MRLSKQTCGNPNHRGEFFYSLHSTRSDQRFRRGLLALLLLNFWPWCRWESDLAAVWVTSLAVVEFWTCCWVTGLDIFEFLSLSLLSCWPSCSWFNGSPVVEFLPLLLLSCFTWCCWVIGPVAVELLSLLLLNY